MKNYEASLDGINMNFADFDNTQNFKKGGKLDKLANKAKEAANKVKAAANKVVHKIEDGNLDAIYMPLVVFKPAMKKALDRKGIKHTNKIDDIASKFLSMITSPKFDEYHLTDIEKEELKKAGKESGAKIGSEAASGNYVGAAKDLVAAIVKYFKNVNEKKAKGVASDEEKELAKDTEKGVDQVADMPEEQVAKEGQTGETKSAEATAEPSKSTFPLLIVAAVVLYALFK